MQQAEFVAQRLRSVAFDVLISSTMVRAKQTAAIIARETGCAVVESELFRELLPASAIWGKSFDDVEAHAVYQLHVAHFEDDAVRHSDEEKFSELTKRCLAALNLLEVRREQSIVVVTHGTVLAALMTYMMRGKDATAADFLRLNIFLHASNTGITKCVIKDNRWRLWTWNDDAHLGEVT